MVKISAAQSRDNGFEPYSASWEIITGKSDSNVN